MGERALSIGFVLPYGEPSDGFFPDTLLAQLCAQAREAGHRAELVRVYYDGRDPARDREVGRRFEAWLEAHEIDVIVLERLFDPDPVRSFVGRAPHRRCVLVMRGGDSFDPVEGVDLVVGASAGASRSGGTRRMPTIAELAWMFDRLLEALAAGTDPSAVPGVARLENGALIEGAPAERGAERKGPFRAVAEQDVIALVPAPRIVRKTLFGNVGCPFASDPLENPHYEGVALPQHLPMARLGCAFCAMGGDYEKRPDAAVVAGIVEQAVFWSANVPELEELVLTDQSPLRYLPALLRAARAAGVRPMRWLYAARADAFVREARRVDEAIVAAAETGQALEVYLTGFESFSDAELLRYNKGATVADLLAAVEAMRRLATASPKSFGFAEARGHSVILWSPWTSPRDVADNADVVREHGLMQLFHEIGRNRLRLYRDLPIYYAAERDGALADAWEEGDEGAGRRKGYNVEQPWRFLDPRTRLAYELSLELRQRLGRTGEVAQLRAAAELAERSGGAALDVPAVLGATLGGVGALEAALGRLVAERPPGAAPRGAGEKAESVLFAGGCNNHCAACANRDRWLDDRPEAVLARVDEARRRGGPIVLAGREPTVHPAFLEAVARARGDDRRLVGVVSNGRRFAYRAFARAAARAGVRAASIKIFAPEAGVADAITEVPGSFEQAVGGLRELRAIGLRALEIRAPLHRDNLASFEAYAGLCVELGAQQIRVEAALDAVGLDHAGAAAEAVDRLAARCARDRIALVAAPLGAATQLFDWIPVAPR